MKPLLLLSAVLLFSSCSSAPTKNEPDSVSKKETLPLVGNFQATRFELANGLRLVVVEDHSSPTFAYQTWFRVGSRDEVPGKTGLAHLFEHLMFKATKNHPDGEFDHLLEAAGVEGENAFTSMDYTAYIQELPKGKLDLIAQLESDRMVNLVVNDKSFKTERDVVQNERRFRNENNPEGMLYQTLLETAFTKQPYHWPTIGYAKDLEEMTSKDALAFYRAHYSPNHATIVVVGDVSPGEVLETVQKYYSKIPPQETPVRMVDADPPPSSPKRATLKLNIQVEKLMVAFRIPAVVSPDIPAISLLQVVLAGGKSSRLFRALVETGIATTVEAEEMENKDPSLFVVSVNLQKGHTAGEAESVILRELESLISSGVSDQELDSAKNRYSYNFYTGLDSSSEKCRFVGAYESIAPGVEAGLDEYQRALHVTGQDLVQVAQKYLVPNSRVVITGVPK